jgi:hypothetical protein
LENTVGDRATPNKKNLALKPRSSLREEGNSHTSLIEVAEEFVDDKINKMMS